MGQKASKTKPKVFILRSDALEIHILNIGGVIQKLLMKNNDGSFEDIVLGFDDFNKYLEQGPYFGAIIGRVANRIAQGQFELDGEQYQLALNDPPNTNHGGHQGFDKKFWTPKKHGHRKLELTYISKDGEENFPGTLTTKVTYEIKNDNELHVAMKSTTTKQTIVNLTSHSYFNLKGHKSDSTILDHQCVIYADSYTPVNDVMVPTGEIKEVKNTPYDFTVQREIGGKRFFSVGGYDNNFVLKKEGVEIADGDEQLKLAAKVFDPESKRALDVYTNQPGLQFYTSNGQDEIQGKEGAMYRQYHGFCLEAQVYPDAVNQPSFPSVVLKPGEEYVHKSMFCFYVKAE
eukprot:TRINITY_DN1424_c0_g1_i2.p1 TRINITY_DN1424_c0_g1~~TRINITY_DN1424_c0_g1_i2.p1  ORF type:complete len:387 (-),score=44.59 TRINITY_DN1424_c0_g1_i2:355-1389(-)